ncbi:MAG: YwaF family protein [Erysipelotrichaceae bacterium]|nr:YwaF family protein [Erysipelotrichaceae bacterium]
MKHLNKDARIKVFNKWWWMYVVLTAVVLTAVTLLGRGLDENGRYRMVLYLSIAELIILRLYKYSLKDIRDDYNWYNELPCYLCNQSTIICIIASIIKDNTLMAYCVSVGTLGAVLAFVMPDSYNRDQLVFSKQAYGFYGYHGLLIVTCLSFYTLGLYIPKISDCLWPAIWTFILAVIAHIVNYILRKTGLNKKSNYVFTWYPDNIILEKMWKLLPVKLLYMLPVMPIFAAFSAVLFGLLSLLNH